jgi:hypothetical protein
MITGITPSSFGFRPCTALTPGAFGPIFWDGACAAGAVVVGFASPRANNGAFRASASDV